MAGADAKQPATAAQLQHTKQGSYGLIATHTKATRQQHNDKLPSPNTVTVELAMAPGHNMVVHGGTHEYSAQCLKGLHEDCANSFQKYKPAKPDIRVHDHHHYHHKARWSKQCANWRAASYTAKCRIFQDTTLP
jgi:hypothetical protein